MLLIYSAKGKKLRTYRQNAKKDFINVLKLRVIEFTTHMPKEFVDDVCANLKIIINRVVGSLV